MPESRYEGLRQRHAADFEAMLPGYTERIDWPADRVQEERLRALRALPATALARPPWHRERLTGVDVPALSEADVASLPVMTKADLMDNFDAIVTDRRITRDVCASVTFARSPAIPTCWRSTT